MQKPVAAAAASEPVDTGSLLERLRKLEREKAALLRDNGNQRVRYERCLSDVTSHVMHVLLAQKVSKRINQIAVFTPAFGVCDQLLKAGVILEDSVAFSVSCYVLDALCVCI